MVNIKKPIGKFVNFSGLKKTDKSTLITIFRNSKTKLSNTQVNKAVVVDSIKPKEHTKYIKTNECVIVANENKEEEKFFVPEVIQATTKQIKKPLSPGVIKAKEDLNYLKSAFAKLLLPVKWSSNETPSYLSSSVPNT